MTTIKFYDADGNEFDTGIEQPNDPAFDIQATHEYCQGWNSAINARILNPYGYDNNERAIRWLAGREAALAAFGVK